MASSPQFPATPIVGQAVLNSSTTSANLYACSNPGGAYIEKVVVVSGAGGESAGFAITLSVGETTTTIYSLASTPSYAEVKLDIAIPNEASIGAALSGTPAGNVHVTLFGGLY